ncbi:hypothetical protein [Roseateles violae]|uniref:Uncharacterized protein n=1 Tax=Roseateles violae TaxID=3058042 RepID=A0ABT8E0C6_9BURK|nr:hypothetical protein [Pelomonas sp. PFR6]MDN3923316.1 hypothetical protein [Pelomonas sp. PFR6]
MAGTQSLIGGGKFPGLALLGWALFKGASGALVKGNGITIARTATGTYTLTMAQAMPSVDVIVDTALQNSGDDDTPNFKTTINNATTITLVTNSSTGGAVVDHPTYYVAVYG